MGFCLVPYTYVALGKLLNISEPSRFISQTENNSAYSLEGLLLWLWHNGLESDYTG